MDECGLTPLRFFERKEDGKWKIHKFGKKGRCKKCRHVGCAKKERYLRIIPECIEKFKAKDYDNLSNQRKQYCADQRLLKTIYGRLKLGERRKLGVCLEVDVQQYFPGDRESYTAVSYTHLTLPTKRIV